MGNSLLLTQSTKDKMPIHELAGKPAPKEMLLDVSKLSSAYYDKKPVSSNDSFVTFGTSGHRGSPLNGTFNEGHVLAISQAICDYRKSKGISGPLFMGMDTHAVSPLAEMTALEVFAANDIEICLADKNIPTPTPVVSFAILAYNREHLDGSADGVVISPSHNPPEDGGFKYNPPNGGPADTDVTKWIQNRANELIQNNSGIRRVPYNFALNSPSTHLHDFIKTYVDALVDVVDMNIIRESGIRIGVDPLGGASLPYWEPIKQKYGINLDVVNNVVDPKFSFMTLDHDGKIRMDCSSKYAMASLVKLKDKYDVSFANDTDADRHGIVVPSGLMNPNHFLAVAIDYLLTNRPDWLGNAAVGKTIVSSSLIDRVAERNGRNLFEVPVGFKWFAPGLFDGTVCFGGEESAGASCLRRDGRSWTTDKDGLIMGLLAAEIKAKTGKDPGVYRDELMTRHHPSFCDRSEPPATPEMKKLLEHIVPEMITAKTLAGDAIKKVLVKAPGNDKLIGGVKVITDNGWFAARPSGTEDKNKFYGESFVIEQHLEEILKDGQNILNSL